MYEPIVTIKQIVDNHIVEMHNEEENYIMESIHKIGIDVDKEELIRALQYDRQQYEKGYQDGLNADKWIPCSEMLPEDDCDVLLQTVHFGIVAGRYEKVFNKDGSNEEMRFLIHKSISSDDMASVDVIAWQPLPESHIKPKQNFKGEVD